MGLFLLALFVINPAAAQYNDVQNTLSRLENEIETLSRAVYRGDVAPPPPRGESYGAPGIKDAAAQAKAEIRIQQLETELQQLRGMLEEQNHQIGQLNKKLDVALGDMQVRMSDINSGGLQGAPGDAPSLSIQDMPVRSDLSNANVEAYTWKTKDQMEEITGMAAPQSLTEKTTEAVPTANAPVQNATSNVSAAMEYETAFSALKSNQYDRAASGFDSFLKNHPGHALAANAKYWLGESYYVQGEFEKASRVFAEGYKQFPKSTKAPDNLLKLGMSLSGMGSNKDACTAFAQLKKEFSSGASPVLRRADQEMQRIGCDG